MKKSQLLLLGLVIILWAACDESQPVADRTDEAHVVMHTDSGDIYLKLYDETPRHKENFLKLVEEGFYDSLFFHRVIDNFIIQAGNPMTRPGAPDTIPDVGYTLPAEIVDTFLHTAGKLGAARLPDSENPYWESSGSNFYIVTGKFASEEDLNNAELAYNYAREVKYQNEWREKVAAGEYDESFNNYLADLGYADFFYAKEQRTTYDQVKGAPNLDFQYTIFGEVVGGMDVVKKIERIPTQADVPRIKIWITSAEVLKR